MLFRVVSRYIHCEAEKGVIHIKDVFWFVTCIIDRDLTPESVLWQICFGRFFASALRPMALLANSGSH